MLRRDFSITVTVAILVLTLALLVSIAGAPLLPPGPTPTVAPNDNYIDMWPVGTPQPNTDLNIIGRNPSWAITPGLDANWAAYLGAARAPARLFGVVQFSSGVWVERRELAEQGIILPTATLGRTADVIIERAALPALRDLIASGYLRYAGPIPVVGRIDPGLWAQAEQQPSTPLPVTVRLFDGVPGDSPVIQALYPGYGVALPGESINFYGWMDAADVTMAASAPQVRYIQLRSTQNCISVGWTTYCTIEVPPTRAPVP